MNYITTIVLLFTISFCYSQHGKLPINQLPQGAKDYLKGHTIKGAALSDSTYYVSSQIKNTLYSTEFNSKGELQYERKFKDCKIIGAAIIFVIIILLTHQL